MAKMKFDVCVYWEERCLEQLEVAIDVPENITKDDGYKIGLTMLGIENELKGKLKIDWSESKGKVDTV